jgi:tetratricopeptide (TPR) repeat protein
VEAHLESAELWCLLDHRIRVEALIDLFRNPTRATVVHAASGLDGMGSPNRCLHALEPPARRPSPARQRELAALRALSVSGHFSQAKAMANELLADADEHDDPFTKAEALVRLGEIYASEDPVRAERSLTAAIIAAEKAQSDELAAMAWTLLVYTIGYRKGDHELARDFAALADELAQRTHQPGTRARVANYLGLMAAQRGELEDALEHYETGSSYALSDPMEARLVLPGLRANRGDALRELGRHEEAEAAYRESIRLSEEAFGPQHPSLANKYHGLADVVLARGDLESARRAYERAISLYQATYGDDHPWVYGGRMGLALVLMTSDRAHEADSIMSDVVTALERLHGPHHRQTAAAYGTAANVKLQLGDFVASIALRRRETEILRAINPEHSALPEAGYAEAVALLGLGRIEEAERMLLAWRPQADDNGTRTAAFEHAFALIALRRNRHDDAAAGFQRALAGWTDSPPGHGYRCRAAYELSKLRWQARQGDQAREAMRLGRAWCRPGWSRVVDLDPREADAWMAHIGAKAAAEG